MKNNKQWYETREDAIKDVSIFIKDVVLTKEDIEVIKLGKVLALKYSDIGTDRAIFISVEQKD